ncbi:hypothetical protein HID58_037078 [Brassica napus]|uniref:Coproporphyrinogen oxidase n=1 Tax=Brassica napus TaxID=3708 RepID=A0ABQ8C9K7_BRANA|nr:hypothetical protein HID58_037078 [Brassica napus]
MFTLSCTFQFHIAFCGFVAVAPPVIFQGKSLTGFLPALELLTTNAAVGICIHWGGVLLHRNTSQYLGDSASISYFRGSGKAAQMKREAATSTLMRALERQTLFTLECINGGLRSLSIHLSSPTSKNGFSLFDSLLFFFYIAPFSSHQIHSPNLSTVRFPPINTKPNHHSLRCSVSIEKEVPETERPFTFLRDSDDDSTHSSSVRARFEAMIRAAQDSVCEAIEAVESGPKFKEDVWSRPGGGGGISRVLQDGNVFEKAGVNVSVVYGVMPPEAYRAAKGSASSDQKPGPVPFFAAGVSSVTPSLSLYLSLSLSRLQKDQVFM